MDSDSHGKQTRGQDTFHKIRFSALRWERRVAERFLAWRTISGLRLELKRTFGEALARIFQTADAVADGDSDSVAQSGQLACKLPAVLQSCDHLSFDDRAEALAYAGLHLLDRYGRVDQVLEYLIRIGRLPLRVGGARVLEVGAGPAPALYATRDFYSALLRWPALDIALGPLAALDTLERGRAWDRVLYCLSESLIGVRGDGVDNGQLPFGRSVHDLAGFDVWERHHRSVAVSAERILDLFDSADEWISDGMARQMAYDNGVAEPSAYDMVFLSYFLTYQTMTERFALELRRLAFSLTPGGLLIVIGGTGRKYTDLYSEVRAIAAAAKLRDISPKEAFRANADPSHLQLVANHVHANVEFALMKAPSAVRTQVEEALPRDLMDDRLPFRLPRFQTLIFVRQAPPRRRKARKEIPPTRDCVEPNGSGGDVY